MVVEVMGRHTGWIAVHSGIAGGADVILIPEQPLAAGGSRDAIEQRHRGGKDFLDRGRQRRGTSSPTGPASRSSSRRRRRPLTSSATSGSAAWATRSRARSRSGRGSRRASRVLGHVQRGGTPGRRVDRVLATVRAQGGRPPARGGVRDDGCAPRRHDRSGVAGGGDGRAEDGSGRLVRRRPSVSARRHGRGRKFAHDYLSKRPRKAGVLAGNTGARTRILARPRRNPCPGGVGSAAHRHQAQEDFT